MDQVQSLQVMLISHGRCLEELLTFVFVQLHMRVFRLNPTHGLLVIAMDGVAGLHFNHIGKRGILYLYFFHHFLKGWLDLLELNVPAVPLLSSRLVRLLLILHVNLGDFFKRGCDFESKQYEYEYNSECDKSSKCGVLLFLLLLLSKLLLILLFFFLFLLELIYF